MTAQTQSFLQGEIVDERYRLGQYLGGSEHSSVFLTRFGDLHPRNAAIKLLPARRGSAELQLSRWRLAANLGHRSLVRILDMGRCEMGSSPMLYVVMELASENLAEILPQRPLTSDEGREMVAPIVDVLSLIHSRGFVHGRIKPSNILVVGEEIKLSSDSICRLSEPVESGSRPSIYDPPEGSRNGATTAGDIWSLGVTIVEALAQEFPQWDPAERREPAIPESVPPPFAEFARHCLRRDPKNRWTAAAIRARLPRARAQAPEPVPEKIEERQPARVTVTAPESDIARDEPGPEPHRTSTPAATQLAGSVSHALGAGSHAVFRFLASAFEASRDYVGRGWGRLAAVEWQRYASAAREGLVTAWKRLPHFPMDAARRHVVSQWRRYALAAGLIAMIIAVALVVSRIGGHNRPDHPSQTASSEVPNRSGAQSPSSRSAPAKPVTRASRPSAPQPKQPREQTRLQQPNASSPAPSAALPAQPTNVPPVASTTDRVQGRVIHQVMPDVLKKASDTVWGTVRVAVRVNVDPAGNVTSASFEAPGPSRYFARISLDAARDWKFAPPQMNGAPVASVWLLHFNYRRDGSTVQPAQVRP